MSSYSEDLYAQKKKMFSRNLIPPFIFCGPRFLLYTVISKKYTDIFVDMLIGQILCSNFLMQSVIIVITFRFSKNKKFLD